MKVVAAFVLFLLTFVATILLLLFFTGNLNQEGIRRLMGNEPTVAAPAQPASGDLGPLLSVIREKESELDEREQEIQEEEQRLALLRQELESLRDNLQKILKDVNQSLDTADANQAERIQMVAKSMAGMEAEKAAQTLTSDMFTPEEAAAVLAQMEDDRDRGNILNEMEPSKAALVLQALKGAKASAQ